MLVLTWALSIWTTPRLGMPLAGMFEGQALAGLVDKKCCQRFITKSLHLQIPLLTKAKYDCLHMQAYSILISTFSPDF
jgi:hypothetical protein